MHRNFFILFIAVIILGATVFFSIYYTNNKRKLLFDNFSQYSNSNIVTIQSPEQTHNKLLENLKKKDFKKATECCFFSTEFKRRKEFFESVQQRGMLEMMISDLSVIKKESITESIATYSYLGSNKTTNTASNLIIFTKDKKGVWRIKSL